MARVVSVEKVDYAGWVYAVEVEEDESFVANGVVVHNCEEGVNPKANLSIISKALGAASECVKIINRRPIVPATR